MYSTEEKICILFGEKCATSYQFFQTLKMFEGVDDLIANLARNREAEKILESCYLPILRGLKNNEADRIIESMTRNEVVAVTYFSSSFPDRLRNIDDPPYVFFCKGNVRLLYTECLSIIGTRKTSSYGRRIAKDFTAVLSEYFTIVSGLAFGIDSIAHETTLQHGGNTIAVLGGGVLNIYPAENKGLADSIVAKNGLLISEYGLYSDPSAYRFPYRNRVVSGLSRGVLVCQAPYKSGTNSTVDLALDQGKDLFVVPGEIYDYGFVGNNRLIRTMQGSCVLSPKDILEYYGYDREEKPKETYQISIEEQVIVNALAFGPLSFDELVVTTGVSPAELNFLLANLELRSIIAKLAGNVYKLYGGLE